MDQTISIIIPCYNQGHFLNDAIHSVINQTYPHWECIIVDDGSSDNTKEIANRFTQKDHRIQYVHKINGGLSSARNKGIEMATGKWLQFLDADDVLESEKFSAQLQAVNENEETDDIVIYGDYVFGNRENVFVNMKRTLPVQFNSANYFEELISRWETELVIPCHCFLFSSNLFLKRGIRFDETLPNHEDFDCWLSVFSKNPRVLFINEVLCHYRLSDESMSTNMRLMGEGFLQVINKHLRVESYSAEIHFLLKRKRLEILQNYRKFNQMTLREKFASRNILQSYYSQRLLGR